MPSLLSWARSNQKILLVPTFILILLFLLSMGPPSLPQSKVQQMLENSLEPYAFQQFYKTYHPNSVAYRIALIADLDKESAKGYEFSSFLRYAELHRDPTTGKYSFHPQEEVGLFPIPISLLFHNSAILSSFFF